MGRAISKAEEVLSPIWSQALIQFLSKAQQEEHGWRATHYPEATLILDCTVQQCNKPTSTFGTKKQTGTTHIYKS
jgi:hypothetical protein